jgi:hypothetical protein
MEQDLYDLQTLLARANAGEAEAAADFREIARPAMVRLVRHVLRYRQDSRFGRRVFAEARRALAACPPGMRCDGEQLARQVTERLCDSLMQHAVPPGGATRCLAESILG